MSTEHEALIVIGKTDMRLSGGPFSRMIYSSEVAHLGLNQRRAFRHKDQDVLVERVNDQIDRWRAEYARLVGRESGREAAEDATRDAEIALREGAEILESALQPGHRSTGALAVKKRKSSRTGQPVFHEPKQTEGIEYNLVTGEPMAYRPAIRPEGDAPVYESPPVDILERILPFVRNRIEASDRAAFDRESERWQAARRNADRTDSNRKRTLDSEKRDWQTREEARRRYAWWDSGDSAPIEQHAELVLNASEYPGWIEEALDFDLRFDVDVRTLIVDFQLPPQKLMPTLGSVTYIQSRDELREKHIPAREQDGLYGDVLYQIALRTVYELYAADAIRVCKAIVFNGWIETVDPGTGHLIERYIMSLRARRGEFLRLNLADVEPEACFRSLGGKSGSRLARLEPVEPIEQLHMGGTS